MFFLPLPLSSLENSEFYQGIISFANVSFSADFKPPSHGKQKVYIAVGVVAFGLCVILSVLGFAWWKGYLGGRMSKEQGVV